MVTRVASFAFLLMNILGLGWGQSLNHILLFPARPPSHPSLLTLKDRWGGAQISRLRSPLLLLLTELRFRSPASCLSLFTYNSFNEGFSQCDQSSDPVLESGSASEHQRWDAAAGSGGSRPGFTHQLSGLGEVPSSLCALVSSPVSLVGWS